MSQETLEEALGSFLDSQPDGEVTIGWQGGEPTMRGLPFFEEAVRLAEEMRRPGQQVVHTIQTNGTLIDEQWASFLKSHNFLVGISIDGPPDLHDFHRVNRAGRGSYDRVLRGWRILQRHGVETNVLCAVNSNNADHPLRVYRHFRDDLGARHVQFIPIVERVRAGEESLAENSWRGRDGKFTAYQQEGDGVTSRTVRPDQYGRFLLAVFDEWFRNDVGSVSVRDFDTAVGARLGIFGHCVSAPECGKALAMDHRGRVYSCDHFVEPAYDLGNVASKGLSDLLLSSAQKNFGRSKRTSLPDQCLACPVLWACNGGCPKDRFVDTGQQGRPLNYLCAGYYGFFTGVQPRVEELASLVAAGRPAADVLLGEHPRLAAG